jgi:hypothetical protein
VTGNCCHGKRVELPKPRVGLLQKKCGSKQAEKHFVRWRMRK